MAVVVGYVPTPEGRAALRQAAVECRLRGVGLVVVRSFKSKDPRPAEPDDDLQAVLGELGSGGIETEVRDLREGRDPVGDILRAAEDEAAEVIVIGLRRRSPVGKLILGDKAQRVLLDSPCPVLAVKAGDGRRS